MPVTYLVRLVDEVLDNLLAGLPAVLLVGPRASGKTTSARRHGATVLRLDQPDTVAAVRLDLDGIITSSPEPVVIDEWQLLPDVLGAVKRAVDDDPRPGRFILTGSVAADLTASGWPATGRVIRVPLWGLTQREVLGRTTGGCFVERLVADGPRSFHVDDEPPSVRDYVELALRGSFPELIRQQSNRLRQAWLSSYVDQLVLRDIQSIGMVRDPVRLRRYLQAVAANTAGIPQHTTLYNAAGIERVTALSYDNLLQATFIVESLPAWTASQLGRLSGLAKRYLTDPAFVQPLLGLDTRGVMRSADMVGRVIDTLVAAQLRPEASIDSLQPRWFHLRDTNGRREVDLLGELADGRVVALEIKAGRRPSADHGRHLAWLRDRLGDRFVLGVVLSSNPMTYEVSDRVFAMPICSMWAE